MPRSTILFGRLSYINSMGDVYMLHVCGCSKTLMRLYHCPLYMHAVKLTVGAIVGIALAALAVVAVAVITPVVVAVIARRFKPNNGNSGKVVSACE